MGPTQAPFESVLEEQLTLDSTGLMPCMHEPWRRQENAEFEQLAGEQAWLQVVQCQQQDLLDYGLTPESPDVPLFLAQMVMELAFVKA